MGCAELRSLSCIRDLYLSICMLKSEVLKFFLTLATSRKIES
jgi:hypothetical protein